MPPEKKVKAPNSAAKRATTTKELLRELEKGRKVRDVAVNNTRQGFKPVVDVDKDKYAKQSGRRPKR